ncbi:MAG: hypothetical protein CVT77_18965, partial [Alphaproteobacteria bacterium HGW-Alphaproteobacteria-16]
MYAYLDRDIAALGPGARFTTWAMRGWVAAIQRRQCPCRALTPGFVRWGVEPALPHLSMAMAILNCEARDQLTFRAPCHPRVAEDEALLLDLLATSGIRAAAEIRATLAFVVAEAGVAPLAAALHHAATALSLKG